MNVAGWIYRWANGCTGSMDKWIVRGVGEMNGWIGAGYRCLDRIKDVSGWKRNRIDGCVGSTQRAVDN